MSTVLESGRQRGFEVSVDVEDGVGVGQFKDVLRNVVDSGGRGGPESCVRLGGRWQ